MKGRILVYGVLAGVLAALALPSAIMGKGSRSLADKWMKEFAGISSLEQAERASPAIATRRLPSGEWLMWRSLNSHGHFRGGTIVTKDSRGAVRAFLGHVCGSVQVRGDTLDEVYRNLTNDFARREYVPGAVR